MNPVVTAPVVPQAQPRPPVCDRWALSGKELLVWALVALALPALVLAWNYRPQGDGAGMDVRVEPAGTKPQSSSRTSFARLDLNLATAAELDLLPGIGPQRAKKILERRGEKGPYRSVAELTEIRGFSKTLVERLEPMLTVITPKKFESLSD